VLRLRLPKGRYALNSHVSPWSEDGDSEDFVLVAPNVVLDRDTTVTMDARIAKAVSFTVPEKTARMVTFSAETIWTESKSQALIMTSNPTKIGQIGAAGPAATLVNRISGHLVDPTARHSPYAYSVAELFHGRLPTGFRRDYRHRDFAAVTNKYRDMPGAPLGDVTVFPIVAGLSGSFVGIDSTITTPAERVDYFSAEGMEWMSFTDYLREPGDFSDVVTTFRGPISRYETGEGYTDVWAGAPLGPADTSDMPFGDDGIVRDGDLILVEVGPHTDAAGHMGHSRASGRTALYRDGTLVAESDSGLHGEFQVPPAKADHRLEAVTRRDFTDLSTEVGGTWNFSSARVEGGPAFLPTPIVRYLPKLGADQAAPAGRDFQIPIRVDRQKGTPPIKTLTVEVSYDDGASWLPAEVTAGNAGWSAEVRHPAGRGYASLRATVADAAGNTTTQHILHAYRLK